MLIIIFVNLRGVSVTIYFHAQPFYILNYLSNSQRFLTCHSWEKIQSKTFRNACLTSSVGFRVVEVMNKLNLFCS